ncbi:MAG: lipopolysaccharide biosynthesis protein [Gemmataceae bacterium]
MSRSFLGHAAIYGLGTFLMQAAGFVLLPLYLRCLSREELGILEVATRLAETAGTLLLFGGFRQALFALYAQAETSQDKLHVVTAVYVLLTSGLVVGLLITLVLPPLDMIPTVVLRLAVITVLLEPFLLMPLSLMQARMQSGWYVGLVSMQFLVRVLLSWTLVAWCGWGVIGVLSGNVLAVGLLGLGFTAWELTRGVVWPRLADVQAILSFALPLVPGGLCFFLLHHGDRFFLLAYATAAEVGEYGIAYKLGMLVTTFGLGPLYMVWSARMYAIAREADAAIVFGQMFTRMLAWLLVVGLGLCLFVEDVLHWMGGKEYPLAAQLVPAVVLACAFQAFATLADGGLYIRRRTDRKLGISILAALVMLLLYALLIPLGGVRGAALATIIGFAALATLTYVFSQPLFPVRYEWGRLAALLAITVGLWLVSVHIPWSQSTALRLMARFGLFLLAPILYATLISPGEWEIFAGWVGSKSTGMKLTEEGAS